jgi:hypothetical protein
VQGQQDLDQKLLVFHLQRQGESIDNATHKRKVTNMKKTLTHHANCQFWLED